MRLHASILRGLFGNFLDTKEPATTVGFFSWLLLWSIPKAGLQSFIQIDPTAGQQ